MRTASASAVATDILARKDVTSLAIIGTEVQGVQRLISMLAVRDIKTVRVWNRMGEKTRILAEKESKNLNLDIQAVDTVEEADEDMDIICAVTGAGEPILKAGWVAEGTQHEDL